MVRCPQCGAEVQADWDWCHACGFDPDAALPAVAPTVHPEVLPGELVPVDTRPRGPRDPSGVRVGDPRLRGGPDAPGGGYVPRPARPIGLVVGGVVAAVVLVVGAILVLGRPAPVTTATLDRSAATVPPTSELAVTTWLLPEGGFAVDLPLVPTETTPPAVPWPFVSGAAYSGTGDGRTYLVASHAVHPDYRWEDIGKAFIDAIDGLAAQHGFATVSRSAGALDEMSSMRFTVVEGRRPDETQVDYEKRLDGPATGEGVALISGNHLYVVLVRSDSVRNARFTPILQSIVVS